MKQGVPLGGQIKAVAHLLERRTNQQLALAGAGDITPMHGMVLAFLCRRPEQALYQKDVENYFSISPSTATCMLKMMEQKGYLRREPVSHDARLKRLVCTPEGEQLFCSINTAVQCVEADLLGPAEAPIFKLNNRYRYTLTLRCKDSRRQRTFLTGILLEFSRDRANRTISIYSDIYL